jgi:hypothetical protein
VLQKPIFETLPIAIIAASIVLMVLIHSLTGLILGGIAIFLACVLQYRRLRQMGTDPDVMDYHDTTHEGF